MAASSSRASALLPLSIETSSGQRATRANDGIPRSFEADSPPPSSSPSSSLGGSRKSSGSYTASTPPSLPAISPTGRKPSSPPVNVYTHCGRHTDQFLFGGRGFQDMWRDLTAKKE